MGEIERRQLLLAAGALLAMPAGAQSQPAGRTFRIGVVALGSPSTRVLGFEQGLRELGYIEGRNLLIERRYAEMQFERLPQLVDEVIRTRPEVIVTGTSVATRAAMTATSTIPIVFTGVSDPIDTKLVTNLARPGGNVTGFSYGFTEGFASKWMQLLKDAAPKVSHVAALHDYASRDESRIVKELRAAARVLKLRIDAHYAASEADLDAALASIGRGGAQGLVVAASPFLSRQHPKVIAYAADKRLPATFSNESAAQAGGLMSYGPDTRDVSRRSASHIVKILKGAKPGDLPVEQPTQFDFVVNLKTARALGLVIPQSLRVSATRVVE